MTKRLLWAGLASGGVVLAAAAAGGLWYFSARMPASVVVAPDRYPEVRSSLKRPVFEHFPPKLPQQGSEPRLYFAPGFLRRATVLEYRFVVPPGAAEPFATWAAKKARGLPDQTRAREMLAGLRTLDDLDPSTPPPEGFEAWIVSHPAPGQWGGVGINARTGEVVCWAIDG